MPHDQCPLAIALRTGEDVAGGERVTERPDGTRVTIAPFPTLLRDAAGKVTGAINMLVDLTASKAADAEARIVGKPPQAGVRGRGRRRLGHGHRERNRDLGPRAQTPFRDLAGRRQERPGLLAGADPPRRSGARAQDDRPVDVRHVGPSHPPNIASAAPTAALRMCSIAARLIRDEAGQVVRAVGAMLDRSEHKAPRKRCGSAGSGFAPPKPPPAWPPTPPSTSPGISISRATWSPGARPCNRRFGLWPEPAREQPGMVERPDPPRRPRARVGDDAIDHRRDLDARLLAEYRFRRADGSYAHVLDRGSLVRDDAGQVVRAIGAMIDLSERRESEQALQVSEERFRLAVGAVGLGVADIDMATMETHWSAEMRQILGVADRCARRRWKTMPGFVHPDDLASTSARLGRTLRGELGNGHKAVHRIIGRATAPCAGCRRGGTRWRRRWRDPAHHLHHQGHHRGKDRAGTGSPGRRPTTR